MPLVLRAVTWKSYCRHLETALILLLGDRTPVTLRPYNYYLDPVQLLLRDHTAVTWRPYSCYLATIQLLLGDRTAVT